MQKNIKLIQLSVSIDINKCEEIQKKLDIVSLLIDTPEFNYLRDIYTTAVLMAKAQEIRDKKSKIQKTVGPTIMAEEAFDI